jgi:hypothetical protein
MSRRSTALSIVLCVLGAACGGGGSGTVGASTTGRARVSYASSTTSPLEVPKDCRPDGSAVELSTIDVTWITADGQPIEPGKACLAVPGGPFTVTLHNDVHGQGIGAVNHNFAVYTDSTTTDTLFRGDIVYAGKSMTYSVPKLPAGVYFFQCDIHAPRMYGTLVVK